MSSAENLQEDFKDIMKLAEKCRFSDCSHTTESQCAVKEAISQGKLSQERLDEYYILKN